MADGGASSASRGRPRDPSLEAKVLEAAMALYAEAGWAGFSFEAVARRAGVGKASLYLRWSSRPDLLRQAFEARWFAVEAIDTGDLRGDLSALAKTVARTLTGPYAGAQPRLALDAVRHPEVMDGFRPYSEAVVRQGRAIVRRAIARGEIPERTNPGLLMDLVVGGVTNHVGATPARLRPAMMGKLDQFCVELVDTALRGVGARSVG